MKHFLILFCTVASMWSAILTDLTETTDPGAGSVLWIVDPNLSDPKDRKITIPNLRTEMGLSTASAAETLWSVNLVTLTEIDTIAELETIQSVNIIVSTEIDTEAELQTLMGSINILLETEIDASSELAALMDDETGSGALVFGTSPTLTTPTFSGAVVFPDNTRQTFNPGANAAGLNVGSHAGDPDTPSNGDLWYDSAAGELTARIAGVNVALGSGGGGSGDVTAAATFDTDNVLIRSDGTGKGVQASGITISDTDDLTTTGTITAGSFVSTGSGANAFVSEGATADEFETTVAVTDPTQDNTLTLPDASGTFILSGHTFTGDVTGTLDTDGSTALTGAATLTRDTEWDTEGEVQTAWGGVNILLESEIDASSELLALMDDETGSGALVFGTSPTLTTPTISGAATLAEGGSITLDAAGSADGAWSGVARAGTAGATLAFGDLVVLDPTDSRWELADANSGSGVDGDARGMIGICVLAAAADGDPTVILLHGVVRADAAFPTLTVNGPIYASETAGDITQTSPTTEDNVVRFLGAATTADEIYFMPDRVFTVYDAP